MRISYIFVNKKIVATTNVKERFVAIVQFTF